MKLEHLDGLHEIQMPQKRKQQVYQHLLKVNKKKQRHGKHLMLSIVMATCILFMIIPQTRLFAYETIEKLWYMTWGEEQSQPASYVGFPEELPSVKTTYEHVSEFTSILNKQLYVPTVEMLPYSYRPFGLDQGDEITSIMLQGESKRSEPISYETMINHFTTDLTQSQLKEMKAKYEQEIAGEYYNNRFSLLIHMYGEASHVTGDVQTMPNGLRMEKYYSNNLSCDVMLEVQVCMDGTLMTYATWIKDDVEYNLVGYMSYDEAKEIIEGMKLQ